jgi:lipopolysaccharide transport system permease protein
MLSALNPRANIGAIRELAELFTKRRQLTFEMARRELSDRYVGQFCGLFWTVGHPLILIAVYVVVFGYIFKSKLGGTQEMPYDYTSYLLSGIIPWLAFQESMAKASTVIINSSALVKQVVFPIEVLPVKCVLATLPAQLVLLVAMILRFIVIHKVALWTYLLIPYLVLAQLLAMIGIGYFLSAISVFFRDTKDFVQIVCLIGFYLIPAIYAPGFLPPWYQMLLNFNPFSHFIYCWQDALYFGRFNHIWSWPIMFILSLGIFAIGYRVFRKFKLMFGNVL